MVFTRESETDQHITAEKKKDKCGDDWGRNAQVQTEVA